MVFRAKFTDYLKKAFSNDNLIFPVKTMTLKAEDFTRRFLLHVLPDGFMRIRHFGFLANRYKKENIKRCRELLSVTEQIQEPVKRKRH